MFISFLAKKYKVKLANTRDGMIGVFHVGTKSVMLFNTKCFMNVSGVPIKRLLDNAKV